ncbi:uncharacterized protein LOC126409915 [Nymphaea colorata]|uniref:uncharacterized protein LOC126409915 n=1 Tax=Nymphaea colorata TaxID=210225 RepID=UPI00214E2E9B|nr:uncharacterized protein LOC126409915 [Nymphaea colorata]
MVSGITLQVIHYCYQDWWCSSCSFLWVSWICFTCFEQTNLLGVLKAGASLVSRVQSVRSFPLDHRKTSLLDASLPLARIWGWKLASLEASTPSEACFLLLAVCRESPQRLKPSAAIRLSS